ncbi:MULTISPECIES: DUF2931 family protein [unclassified Serratia (in: enterobacteria)]|uniref:DUF2931 family protein n=1 Tax=unclassified Serratia (in: enterobacteria) TaxID=2647522 RepID=UPI000F71D8D4|nr:DUF2931 family protein [Serratia sp. C2(2)]MEE4449585.1 DUF2931 family protein [Serratia sp. C2(1)]VEA68918.1 Protein of uncharacterised function (DUF2931) [Serratia plymuthica]
MEIMRLAGLLSVLTLTACQGAGQPDVVAVKSDVPTEWKFNFFTPKALPAMVTFAIVIGTDDWVYRFVTLDSTPDLDKVIGEWNNRDRAPGGHWNHITRPPKRIFFCWDSVIDKKVYETYLTLPDAVVEKMQRPSGHNDPYNNTYNTVQIGLAPEGKVAVWLLGIGFEPNYRVTPSVIKTVSGDKLELCKGVTKHPNGYKYYGETPDFIKGKKYPYGNWN